MSIFDVDVKDKNTIEDIARKFTGEILYGVPSSTAYSRDEATKNNLPYNNAEILALMERGSPINNIPMRKLLVPVREKHREEIDEVLQKVCKLIYEGEQEKADLEMERLAIRIENWTKQFFTEPDNGWAPNAPSTIKRKGSNRPLIDTGALRQSIKAFYRKGDK